uniref:Uncharacterized protein n=1 Tax=Triticum urartu TaxID=4572 RepID=A0A8R7PX71_TRIUA
KRKLPHPLTPRTLALPLPHTFPRLPHRRRHPADPIPPDSDPTPPPAPARHHPLLVDSRRTSAALPPPVPEASVGALRRRAAALIPPSAPHLHRHLRWVLADAYALPRPARRSGTSTGRTWWSLSGTSCSSRGPRRRPSWTWSPPPTASGGPGPLPRRPRRRHRGLTPSPCPASTSRSASRIAVFTRLVEEGWSSCRSCYPCPCSSSAPPGSSSTSSWRYFHPTLPVPMVLFLVSTRPREL